MLGAFLKHSDGTISSIDGRELFLGIDRFKSLVRNSSRCFVCGTEKSEAPFNDEHILPDWVLRRFSLVSKSIRLGNGTTFPYSRYKIRCCQDCNSFFGRTFEGPISKAIELDADAFSDWFKENVFTVFLWINFVFLKIHLKDNQLRADRNLKAPDVKLGDAYDWSELHHCHALIRAARMGHAIDVNPVLGSTMCLQLGEWADDEPFDYNDHLDSHTVMIRLGSKAFICTLNDSCGVLQGLEPRFKKLPPDMDPVQFLEILSEFQFVSVHLKYRPKFFTIFDPKANDVRITGELPELFDLEELDFQIRGLLMARNIYSSFPKFRIGNLSTEETEKLILSGEVSFL